jgi:hypothetical protein
VIHRFRVSAYGLWGMIRDDWQDTELDTLDATIRKLWRRGIKRVTVWDSEKDDCHELLDVDEVDGLLRELTGETTVRP